MGTWRNEAVTLLDLASNGYIRVRENPSASGANNWSISYITEGHRAKIEEGEIPVLGRDARDGSLLLGDMRRPVIPKTVWKRRLHDARNWGTPILRALVGNGSFTYPKSPYAVLDALSTIVASRPDAVVLDFFAGSGTTLHSVCMLNARDGGRRRAILVTNNEVSEADEQRLLNRGVSPGDAEWEALSICRHVTWPRTVAAITGVRPSGVPIVGEYDDGTPMAEGFCENAAFFDLVYVDPDAIDVAGELDEILPALWLAAGCHGNPGDLEHDQAWLLSSSSRFAVLLDEDRFRAFRNELGKHPDITHVWLVTDSETAFARMRDELPGIPTVGRLYRDYLRNFRVTVDICAGMHSRGTTSGSCATVT